MRSLLKTHAITPHKNNVLELLEQELEQYFNHQLTTFTVPLNFIGSPFQQTAWQALTTIPYGQTKSYKQQATSMGNAKAYRAVGTANGANMIAIVIPCHRIIAHDGTLGGYNGGLERKKSLLMHETKNCESVIIDSMPVKRFTYSTEHNQ